MYKSYLTIINIKLSVKSESTVKIDVGKGKPPVDVRTAHTIATTRKCLTEHFLLLKSFSLLKSATIWAKRYRFYTVLANDVVSMPVQSLIFLTIQNTAAIQSPFPSTFPSISNLKILFSGNFRIQFFCYTRANVFLLHFQSPYSRYVFFMNKLFSFFIKYVFSYLNTLCVSEYIPANSSIFLFFHWIFFSQLLMNTYCSYSLLRATYE